MKVQKLIGSICAAATVLLLLPAANADITIDTVTVGNPGNAADATGFGSVNHVYGIGKYEVTDSQYTTFLNSVAKTDTYSLYNSGGVLLRHYAGRQQRELQLQRHERHGKEAGGLCVVV